MMFGCTVYVFNIGLEKLVSWLFCLKKQDSALYSKLHSFFLKRPTLTQLSFDVLQCSDLQSLNIMLRLAARRCYR